MSDVLYSPLFVTNTKVLPLLLLLSLFSVAVIIMHAIFTVIVVVPSDARLRELDFAACVLGHFRG